MSIIFSFSKRVAFNTHRHLHKNVETLFLQTESCVSISQNNISRHNENKK